MKERSFFEFIEQVLMPRYHQKKILLTLKEANEYNEFLQPSERSIPLKFKEKEIKIV